MRRNRVTPAEAQVLVEEDRQAEAEATCLYLYGTDDPEEVRRRQNEEMEQFEDLTEVLRELDEEEP